MTLTAHQIKIAKLMIEGLSVKEISYKMGKPESSIRSQKMYMYLRNNCQNSAQFIYKAAKAGLI